MLLGVGAKGTDINIYIPGKFGTDDEVAASGAYPGGNLRGATVAVYWAAATKDYYSGAGIANQFKESDFTRVGDGILKFKLVAGVYVIYAKSGDGSGSYHGEGRTMQGELTLSSDTDILLLIPNHGCGSYSAGGGFFLIAGTDYTSTSNTPLLILGGGGGGYGGTNNWALAGSLSTNLTQSRLGPSSGTSGLYDGGASWKDEYTVEKYGTDGVANAAQNFTSGGRGGYMNCSHHGGFGGGGGGCPGGGGGLFGGYPGTDTHSGGGYGASQGGGGGRSYYNSSYITTISGQYGGSMDNTNYQAQNVDKNGYFGIYGPT